MISGKFSECDFQDNPVAIILADECTKYELRPEKIAEFSWGICQQLSLTGKQRLFLVESPRKDAFIFLLKFYSLNMG
jgi:hypothetical protein